MTTEQKARAYDEALERAIEWYNNPNSSSVGKAYLYAVFPELAESDDEKIRKSIIHLVNAIYKGNEFTLPEFGKDLMLKWLEKQREKLKKVSIWKHWKDGIAGGAEGEQIFLIKTGNVYSISSCLGYECDYIELSELDKLMREEEQGKTALEAINEEKVDNTNKEEPKFHEGNWVVYNNDICQIVKREEGCNKLVTVFGIEKELVNERNLSTTRLWTIQDAKDGDVLMSRTPFIYGKQCPYGGLNWYNNKFIKVSNFIFTDSPVHPATKEQRELLFQKMHEAGYEWDAEKKELKKIEEEINGEDYGIDSLYHPQRILEKTLGKVDGYQSDDGILEHKCAISAVKKLYEQKSAWSEEDEHTLQGIIDEIEANKSQAPDYDLETYDRFLSWLEKLKQRI